MHFNFIKKSFILICFLFQHSVDQDNLEYQFTTGNQNSAFTILDETGEIRLARKLDFDDPNEEKVGLLDLQ